MEEGGGLDLTPQWMTSESESTPESACENRESRRLPGSEDPTSAEVKGRGKGKGEASHRGAKGKGAQKGIRITTINVRRLNQSYGIEYLQLLLRNLSIDVCVVTETHLDQNGVDRQHFPGKEIKGRSCRTDSANGGVIILISIGVDSMVAERAPDVPFLLSVCSVIIFPKNSEIGGLRITGVYFPPCAKVRPGEVYCLTANDFRQYSSRGDMFSQTLAGDFNPNSWRGEKDTGFQEWSAESAAWELSDPAIPTHTEGPALDCFAILPGGEIP